MGLHELGNDPMTWSHLPKGGGGGIPPRIAHGYLLEVKRIADGSKA